ncbi:hypothetical protein WJX81_007644 [Elliptochloris bilobata]|uniref:Uncharacterized protein n=1 Tax=Elliptochloris bilobata TaxID=381761 RepID=A0AAW1RII5_9CHLO
MSKQIEGLASYTQREGSATSLIRSQGDYMSEAVLFRGPSPDPLKPQNRPSRPKAQAAQSVLLLQEALLEASSAIRELQALQQKRRLSSGTRWKEEGQLQNVQPRRQRRGRAA